MPRDVRVYLEDLLAAVERVRLYTGDLTRPDIDARPMVRDAVLHNLQIIGEAAKRIPEELRRLEPGIEWRKVSGLRDLIAHAYFDIDTDIIWDVISTKLDPLHTAVVKLLQALDP